jgi:hypothetical protein
MVQGVPMETVGLGVLTSVAVVVQFREMPVALIRLHCSKNSGWHHQNGPRQSEDLQAERRYYKCRQCSTLSNARC